jgi:hypothetical protein
LKSHESEGNRRESQPCVLILDRLELSSLQCCALGVLDGILDGSLPIRDSSRRSLLSPLLLVRGKGNVPSQNRRSGDGLVRPGWGILGWPQVGEFGWPPGKREEEENRPPSLRSERGRNPPEQVAISPWNRWSLSFTLGLETNSLLSVVSTARGSYHCSCPFN